MAGSPSHSITHDPELTHDFTSPMTLEASFQLEDVMTSSQASLDHPAIGTNGDWRGTGRTLGYLPSAISAPSHPPFPPKIRRLGNLVGGYGDGVSLCLSIVPAGKQSVEGLDPDFDDTNMDSGSSTTATLGLPSEKTLGKRKVDAETSEPILEDGFQHKNERENDLGNMGDYRPAKKVKITAHNKDSLVLNWPHQSENTLPGAHDVPTAGAPDDDLSMFPVNINPYDPSDDSGAMYELPGFEPSLWLPSASFFASPEVGMQELSIPSLFGTTEKEGCSSVISATGLVPWSQMGPRLSPLNEEYAPPAYVIEPRLQQHSKPPTLRFRILSGFKCIKAMSDQLRRDLLRKLTESAVFATSEWEGEGIDTAPQVPPTAEVKDFSRLFALEVARARAALDNAPLKVGLCDDDWNQDTSGYFDDDYDF